MYSTDEMEYGVYPLHIPVPQPFPWVCPVSCGYNAIETERVPAPGTEPILLYLLEGEGEIRLDGQTLPYKGDCIAIASSADALTILPTQRTEYLFLLLKNADDLLDRLASGHFVQSIQAGCRADRLLGRICHSVYSHRPVTAYSASADAFALLMELMEHIESIRTVCPPLVQEALRIIRHDYAFLTGVDELADRLAVSREHLIRSFHAATGQSPGRCLQNVKLDNARLMLQNRDYSIEMVADMAGYSGANYFCKVFRRATGESPGEYRTRYMNMDSITDADSEKKLEEIEGLYQI